MCIWDRIKIY